MRRRGLLARGVGAHVSSARPVQSLPILPAVIASARAPDTWAPPFSRGLNGPSRTARRDGPVARRSEPSSERGPFRSACADPLWAKACDAVRARAEAITAGCIGRDCTGRAATASRAGAPPRAPPGAPPGARSSAEGRSRGICASPAVTPPPPPGSPRDPSPCWDARRGTRPTASVRPGSASPLRRDP